jgi:hypothetical protein
MCRITKLTEEMTEKICEYIKAGSYAEVAAQACGIDRATYYGWMKKGREKTGTKIHVDFFDRVQKALAYNETRNAIIITRAAETNWTAAAWLLERKHPERWGRERAIEQNEAADTGARIADGLKAIADAIQPKTT